MNRLHEFGISLFCLLVFSALTLSTISAQANEVPPNIIVILTDDLSKDLFDTLADNGWLPNIKEHIINNGIRFENSFVTNAVCCPSRATLLTGLYSHNHGVFSNKSPHPLKAGITWPGWLPKEGDPGKEGNALPVWIRAKGYYTGYIGKYLNGYGISAPDTVSDPKTYIPAGWDDWQGLIDPTTYKVYDYMLNDNGSIVSYGTAENDYQTDVLAGRAVEFINSRATTDEPFFLIVSPLAPHVEVDNLIESVSENNISLGYEAIIRPAPRHEHLVDKDLSNNELPGPPMKPSFNEQDMSDKPSCPFPWPEYGLYMNFDPFCIGDMPEMSVDIDVPNVEQQFKHMGAALLAVDDMVGDIVRTLSEKGLFDQTVIIFTSDNGWFFGEHRSFGKEAPYEESIRVPLVVKNADSIDPAIAKQIVVNNDLAPTIAELANAEIPYHPDGRSFQPLLQNPSSRNWQRKTFLIEHWYIPSLIKFQFPTAFAIRHVDDALDYLYVNTHADKIELNKTTYREFYDLNSDPYQLTSYPIRENLTRVLDNYLNYFRLCKDGNCEFIENF